MTALQIQAVSHNTTRLIIKNSTLIVSTTQKKFFKTQTLKLPLLHPLVQKGVHSPVSL